MHHLGDQVKGAKGLTAAEKEVIRQRYSATEYKPEPIVEEMKDSERHELRINKLAKVTKEVAEGV